MYFLAMFAFSCAASCPGAPAMPMTPPGAICCQRRYSSGVQAPDAKVSGGSRVMVADQNRRRGNFVIAESASIIRDLWLHAGLAGHGPRLLYRPSIECRAPRSPGSIGRMELGCSPPGTSNSMP
jgi:hypothetical protein